MFCSKSCHACHLRREEVRCTRRFLRMSQEPALQPGDMEETFQGLAERAKQYDLRILSRSPWKLNKRTLRL